MSSREKAKMVIHTHRSRCGEGRRRPAQGACGRHTLRESKARGPPRPGASVATPSLPACAITESSFISTAGQDAPRGRGSWAHAPCRNNQTLSAGRPRVAPRSCPPSARALGTPSPCHTDGRGPSTPGKERRTTPLPAKVHAPTAVPRGCGAAPCTRFLTSLLSVRDPPHPACPGPAGGHLVGPAA